jgi:hypothetical protein
MDAGQAPESTLLKTLGSISTIAAALSFGVLSIAFIHEWGYFGIVGRQFQTFMSASDYVASAVGWLPLMVAVLVAAYVNEHFTRRLEGFRTESEIAASFETPRRWWWAREAPWFFLPWIILFNAAIVLVMLNIYQFGEAIALGATIIWYWGVQWYVSHQSVALFMTSSIRLGLLLFLPPIALWAFILGQASGYRDLTQPQRTYTLKLKKDEADRNVVLLRTLGVGILIRELQEKRVTFVKWDEVSILSLRVQLPDNRSWACWLWERMCFEGQTPPTP